MSRKLIRSFLKDQFTGSIVYFSGIFLVGLFYYLDTGQEIELLYPVSLAFAVYLAGMLFRFGEYYKIHKGLEELAENCESRRIYHDDLYIRIDETIKKLHMNYLDKLGTSQLNRKKERRFLSMWIHNMKTPITVTNVLLQRMERGELDTAAGLEAIREENEKLLGSLDAVLNMIRLEDFAKDYIPEPMDLLTELNKVINHNKSLFIHNRVFPKVVTGLSEARILSDKKWNELLVTQLISNAVKYSREEDVSKNIYFNIERKGQEIILTIRDEGIGIPKHDLDKIYEPFFTGDNGRLGYQSSGIGLYFCKEICKHLGHSLQITSEAGKGTSVQLSYLAKL